MLGLTLVCGPCLTELPAGPARQKECRTVLLLVETEAGLAVFLGRMPNPDCCGPPFSLAQRLTGQLIQATRCLESFFSEAERGLSNSSGAETTSAAHQLTKTSALLQAPCKRHTAQPQPQCFKHGFPTSPLLLVGVRGTVCCSDIESLPPRQVEQDDLLAPIRLNW